MWKARGICIFTRMPKSIKKFLLFFAGSFIFLLLAAWAILALYHDDVRLKAEQIIDKQVDALVTFDDVSLTFLRDFPNLTITLHNLTITGKGEFANDTLARVDEFDLEIKTSSLLYGKETELKSIHVHSPEVFLKVLKNGKTNYNIFLSDSLKSKNVADSSELNLALDEVKISDGVIEYRDLLTNSYALLKGMDYRGAGDFQKDLFDFTTSTLVKEFTLDYAGVTFFSQKELAIDLVMEMNVREHTVTLKENKIRINRFTVGIEGSFGIAGDGYDLDLSFNTKETDFKTIISLVPGIFMEDFKQITTKGQLAFKGFVSGHYSPNAGKLPSFLTDFKVTDAMFKIDTLPDPIENIQLELVISNLYGNRDSTLFDLKNFQFDMRHHPVKGRIKVQGLNHYKIDADVIANVDLSELEMMYPIKGLELKGAMDFELKTKGPLAWTGTSFQHIPVFHLDMKLKDGKIKYDHLPAAIDNIQFQLVADNQTGELEKSVFDFRSLHLDLDKNRVHGFLRLEGFENMKVKTDLKADLDLADVEKMFPMPGIVMKGDLSLDAEADGIYNKSKKKFPSIDAKLELVNGYLLTKGYPEPMENVHFSGEAVNTTGHFSDTHLAINRLTYSLEKEIFEVRGTVSDLNNCDYDLKIKGLIDLEKLTKIYPISEVQLSGIIISDVETRGRLSEVEAGFYERITSDGRIDIKNLTIQIPTIPKPLTVYDATYTFTPSKIVLEKFIGKFGRSHFSMTGDLYNYMAFATRSQDLIKCDINLKCDTLDLNEWLSEKKLPATTKLPGLKINVWQVPLNVDVVFDSEIEHVRYEDMKISKLDGEIKMKEGVLTLRETGFNTLDAKFSISGDYNTRDMKHPFFDVDLDIKELDINKAYREMKLVRDLLPVAGDADGIFSVSYKLKGELSPDFYPRMETLLGGGEMRIANARINGMKIFEELSKASKKKEVNDPHLKDFVMRSEIRDSKIIVKPFSIKLSSFDADVEGVSEISGAIRYLVKLELPPFGVKVPFHVTGTYKNPKVVIGKGHVLYDADSLPK